MTHEAYEFESLSDEGKLVALDGMRHRVMELERDVNHWHVMFDAEHDRAEELVKRLEEANAKLAAISKAHVTAPVNDEYAWSEKHLPLDFKL